MWLLAGFIVFFLCIWLLGVYSSRTGNSPGLTEEPPREPILYSEPLTAKLTESYLTLDNYIGQSRCVEYLLGHIRFSLERSKALPHIVLWGSGGLGKSTLMKATAHKMGGRFIEIVPANLRNINDVFGVFFDKQCSCGYLNPYSSNTCLGCRNKINIFFLPVVKLQDKDIVFLEECHKLKTEIEEALYSLMQDGYMMVRYNGIDQRVTFPNITVAGATTRLGDLQKPFRDRFKIDIQLQPYSDDELCEIIRMYCENKSLIIDDDAIKEIAVISYGVPRISKKYVDDSATRGKIITLEVVKEVRELLDIDENGLDVIHRKALDYIHVRNQAGHGAISSAIGIPTAIYLEVYEPGLIQKELIWQGNRGRTLTPLARESYFSGCECKYCKEN